MRHHEEYDAVDALAEAQGWNADTVSDLALLFIFDEHEQGASFLAYCQQVAADENEVARWNDDLPGWVVLLGILVGFAAFLGACLLVYSWWGWGGLSTPSGPVTS